MYTAIYRAYRPETFDSVLGQEHIVKILKNQIQKNSVAHAYLFCGTRGTGKTTMARILAKGVNCISDGEKPCGICENCKSIKEGTHIDVIEIDAASNNGVDNIRELKESVKYPPAVGKKKVYIIDEVHMLSIGAFNALLKTLEEPPENVMFILATTEQHKLPATILSRCLKLDFKRVPEKVIKGGMEKICKDMGIDAEEGALGLISANADGSVRDGLSLLEQCLATGESHISREDVLDVLGTAGEDCFISLTSLVKNGNISEILISLNEILSEGKDSRQLIKDWVGHYRSLLIAKYVSNPEDLISMSKENLERLSNQARDLEISEINRNIIMLSKTLADAKWSSQPRILLELCAINMASEGSIDDVPVVMEKKVRNSTASKVNKANPEIKPESNFIDEPEKLGDILSTPKEVEPAKELQEKKDSSGASEIDSAGLWKEICEIKGRENTNFKLICTSTAIEEISEDRVLISASNSITKATVEKLRTDIEMAIKEKTGIYRTLKCDLRDNIIGKQGEEGKERVSAEDIQKDLMEKFSLDVTIS